MKASLPHCLKQECRAPEHEGSFLTDVFRELDFNTECNARSYLDSGLCASVRSTAIAAWLSNTATESLRLHLSNRLFNDWSRFWRSCKDKRGVLYLVEKDIPTLHRSRLLSFLFGGDLTNFVIVLRHPFAACIVEDPQDLSDRCHMGLSGMAARAKSWLVAHETAFADSDNHRSVVAFQLERLRAQPASVLKALGSALSFGEEPLVFNYSTVPSLPSRRLGIKKSSLSRLGGVTILPDTGAAARATTFQQRLLSDGGLHASLLLLDEQMRRLAHALSCFALS